MSANSGAVRKGASLQTWLILFLLAAIVLAGADFFLLNRHDAQDRTAAQLTTQIQVNSQQVANFAMQAANGNIDAFKELASTRAAIAAAVQHLNQGDDATGLPAYGDAIGVRDSMTALTRSWDQLSADLGKIEANKDAVLDSASQAAAFNQQMPDLNSKINQVINILQSKGSASSIYTASQLMVSGDRLIRRVGDVLQGGVDSASAANGLALDSTNYGSTLKQLAEGSSGEADRILTGVQKSWAGLEAPVQKVIAAAPTLVTVKNAATQASVDSQDVLLKAHSVSTALGKLPQTRPFPNVWWGLLGAVAAAVLAVFLALNFIRTERKRSADSRSLNERNQQAIMRLLDEMGTLAEGDLTVKATVTEDITGAIADSVNFAVEALRSLVTTINETAVRVSSAAQETQATAKNLADAANQQAVQITSASAKINEMAVSIDQVSKNSADSAEVAQRSVQIASNGAQIVRQTISGMDSIREQIQETSKRIKRLGESSQEIGSIVELINDIAEQTNILALNAAIQAASAGEAGRGFAVVADEVQRLAERSAGATKRIETLVQTIQSDTVEAVSSMEQTTTQVVNGARLAEDAGTALGEIEKVSNNLAGLIQGISSAAKQQSAAATNISSTMSSIQQITTQTSVGASQTAESIGNLANLAQELRRSVADFKLPA
ncbi:MAG: type IV pili methyl-accepting chemotaxis transducer N-terminal domain-containing protein [Proteobacteria bacterium]|nr:type IV pili methyl-accepting chemotaxis transducer N-terminal domain-containing protein [Pseudomonadota bacterium]